MKFTVLTMDIVKVIGGNQSQIILLGQLQEPRISKLLFPKSMVLNLQEKIILAENIYVFPDQGIGLFHIPCDDSPGNFPCHAGTEADKPFVIFSKQFLVNPRLVIQALTMGQRNQLHQIAITLLVFRQKNQMVVFDTIYLFTILTCTWCQIYLTTYNRLYALLFGFFVEVNYTVHHPMVRDGYGIHAQFLGCTDKVANTAGSIQQTEFSMNMQMCKRHN